MTLFSWPSQTLVNRVMPKSKLYANAQLSTRMRQRFVSDVQQIVWQAKLAPETVHLAATGQVSEIQIVELVLRTMEIQEDILAAIDRAIHFPILFELTYAGRVKMAAAWKRPGPTADKWILGDYLTTPWMPTDVPRKMLPMALDLGGLYEQLLRKLAPFPPRRGESLKDHMDRLARIRNLERDRGKLELRLAREKQFNRKVEINTRIRALQKEIELLTAIKISEDMPRYLEKTSS